MGLIDKLETIKLDITDIRKSLQGHASVLLYDTLSHKKADVFKDHDCVVVLYESTIGYKQQGHYVVLLKRGENVTYFSSLGKSPQDELSILELNATPKFSKILGKNYNYNRVALQNKADYQINTCGLWVIARCLLQELTNSAFIRLFKTNLRTTDEKISFATLLLLKKMTEVLL